jgi:hypothetical protein
VVRYSFIVVDFHLLLLAGIPAHPVQLFDVGPFDILSRVLCLVHVALHRYVYLFAPSLRWVPWPLLSEALRFPTFIGTMGSYDCSPTRPCRLRSPLAAGTPRRGSVRFPWDTLASPGPGSFRVGRSLTQLREEVRSSPGFAGSPLGSMPRARDSGDSSATSRLRLSGCCLPLR